MIRTLFICGLIAAVSSAVAQQKGTGGIPDPLSLQQAIGLIDDMHPELISARLDIERAEIDREHAKSLNAFSVDANARLQWVEPNSNSILDERKDHKLGFSVSKPLYDGGRSSALLDAAMHSNEAATLDYMQARDEYVILVMQRFFDIIVADLRAGRDLEAMSVAFIQHDRGKDRFELGKISEIELLALESAYQNARQKLYESDGHARSTRVALALALNRPGEQPSQLTPPALNFGELELMPQEKLSQLILANNRVLQALMKQRASAIAKIEAARSGRQPSLVSELERAEYTRDTSSTDQWRIGVTMKWPIYDGGRTDVDVRRAQLELTRVDLNIRRHQNNLNQRILDLAERFRVLKAEGDASAVFRNFREIYLDRSRALYEMEVKTDLGDAMVEISESQRRSARQLFSLALTLARLNALAGKPVMDWQALTVKKAAVTGE